MIRILLAVVALVPAPVNAQIGVVRFGWDGPFDPWTESIRLTDFDADAPDITLSFFARDPGDGTNAVEWMPQIIGTGWTPVDGHGLRVESNIGPGQTSGAADGFLWGSNYDELLEGDEISGTAPGPWGIASREVFHGAAPNNYPLELVVSENQPIPGGCTLCPHVEEGFSMTPGVKFVGIRWEEAGETYYGWVAFRLSLRELFPPCRLPDPFACRPSDFEGLSTMRVNFIAAGYQMAPDTPIDAGAGGLCQADLNADSLVDFFDLAEFLRLFGTGHPDADVAWGDGLFNFHDVAVFLARYNDGCGQ